jgi:hypothetical protein
VTGEGLLAIHERVLGAIPPLVSEEDIETEKRRAWDETMPKFDAEEEREKVRGQLEHIERMLESMEFSASVIPTGGEEKKEEGGGELSDDPFPRPEGEGGAAPGSPAFSDGDPAGYPLDSPRLRSIRPVLSLDCRLLYEADVRREDEERREREERLLGMRHLEEGGEGDVVVAPGYFVDDATIRTNATGGGFSDDDDDDSF